MEDEIPRDFTVCDGTGCEKSDGCLRHGAFEAQTQACDRITVISPRAHGSGCAYFLSTEKETLAWGIKNFYDDIPLEKARSIKCDLIAKFGRSRYYRFYREELPVDTAARKVISGIFKKHSVQSDPPYTRFTEAYSFR